MPPNPPLGPILTNDDGQKYQERGPYVNPYEVSIGEWDFMFLTRVARAQLPGQCNHSAWLAIQEAAVEASKPKQETPHKKLVKATRKLLRSTFPGCSCIVRNVSLVTFDAGKETERTVRYGANGEGDIDFVTQGRAFEFEAKCLAIQDGKPWRRAPGSRADIQSPAQEKRQRWCARAGIEYRVINEPEDAVRAVRETLGLLAL